MSVSAHMIARGCMGLHRARCCGCHGRSAVRRCSATAAEELVASQCTAGIRAYRAQQELGMSVLR